MKTSKITFQDCGVQMTVDVMIDDREDLQPDTRECLFITGPYLDCFSKEFREKYKIIACDLYFDADVLCPYGDAVTVEKIAQSYASVADALRAEGKIPEKVLWWGASGPSSFPLTMADKRPDLVKGIMLASGAPIFDQLIAAHISEDSFNSNYAPHPEYKDGQSVFAEGDPRYSYFGPFKRKMTQNPAPAAMPVFFRYLPQRLQAAMFDTISYGVHSLHALEAPADYTNQSGILSKVANANVNVGFTAKFFASLMVLDFRGLFKKMSDQNIPVLLCSGIFDSWVPYSYWAGDKLAVNFKELIPAQKNIMQECLRLLSSDSEKKEQQQRALLDRQEELSRQYDAAMLPGPRGQKPQIFDIKVHGDLVNKQHQICLDQARLMSTAGLPAANLLQQEDLVMHSLGRYIQVRGMSGDQPVPAAICDPSDTDAKYLQKIESKYDFPKNVTFEIATSGSHLFYLEKDAQFEACLSNQQAIMKKCLGWAAADSSLLTRQNELIATAQRISTDFNDNRHVARGLFHSRHMRVIPQDIFDAQLLPSLRQLIEDQKVLMQDILNQHPEAGELQRFIRDQKESINIIPQVLFDRIACDWADKLPKGPVADSDPAAATTITRPEQVDFTVR